MIDVILYYIILFSGFFAAVRYYHYRKKSKNSSMWFLNYILVSIFIVSPALAFSEDFQNYNYQDWDNYTALGGTGAAYNGLEQYPLAFSDSVSYKVYCIRNSCLTWVRNNVSLSNEFSYIGMVLYHVDKYAGCTYPIILSNETLEFTVQPLGFGLHEYVILPNQTVFGYLNGSYTYNFGTISFVPKFIKFQVTSAGAAGDFAEVYIDSMSTENGVVGVNETYTENRTINISYTNVKKYERGGEYRLIVRRGSTELTNVVTTDAEGFYILDSSAFWNATYTAEIKYNGVVQATNSFQYISYTNTEPIINLSGNIKFQDTDGIDYNLQNAKISLGGITKATTDINGDYTIVNYETGTYKVNYSAAMSEKTFVISTNATSQVHNDLLLFSKPSISLPILSGNKILGTYSHNFKSMLLWENPMYVWGKYDFLDTPGTYYQGCLYSGAGTEFQCGYISNRRYNFRFVFTDVFNNNLSMWHPTLTGSRNFTSGTLSIDGNMTSILSRQRLSGFSNRDEIIGNYFWEFLFLILAILAAGFLYSWDEPGRRR